MRLVVLAAVAVVLAACTAAIGSRPDQPSSSAPAAPTLPVVNVSDMMGGYPQQTVFVPTADHVSAVTLLNHFVRYQIPTDGFAEVKADPVARWLYVLDGANEQGGRRLRVFDIPTGAEHAALDGITNVVAGGHALGATADGRVLVLKSDSNRAWVDAYQAETLESASGVMQGPGCGHRLVSIDIRMAIICSSTGEVVLSSPDGRSAKIDSGLTNIVAAASSGDGALYLLTAEEHLVKVAAGAALTPVALASADGWSGNVVTDGLTVAQDGTQLVIVESNSDSAWVRTIGTTDISHQRRFHLAGVPNAGVVAMWPFAYYGVGSSIRHVDLTSGLLEIMAEVGPGAAAAAVVNG